MPRQDMGDTVLSTQLGPRDGRAFLVGRQNMVSLSELRQQDGQSCLLVCLRGLVSSHCGCCSNALLGLLHKALVIRRRGHPPPCSTPQFETKFKTLVCRSQYFSLSLTAFPLLEVCVCMKQTCRRQSTLQEVPEVEPGPERPLVPSVLVMVSLALSAGFCNTVRHHISACRIWPLAAH